ncbi:hypothetical protein EAT43_23555, partial [Vibrio parahaemolyticus]|nr:hypothetical protein [Vibrio parahaemolyticus]
KKKKAKKKLINFLNNFCTSDDVILYQKYEITDKLSLSFIKGTYKECTPTFQLGEIIEHEIGEFIFKDISTNINFCIENKSSKIEPYKSQYPEWWLVLIDTIAEGCYTEYIKDFEKVIDKGIFDKVIVLEPSNGNYIFEI